MKINKWQRFYLDTTLEAVDQQLTKSMEELEDIYATYYKDRETLVNELSRVILEYNVKGEYMEIDAKDKKKIQDNLNKTVKSFIGNEKDGDKSFIDKALNDAINGAYGYKEYTLGLGIDFKSLPLAEKEVQKIINNEVMGKNWSDRLWDNKGALENQLRKDIFDFCKGTISVNDIKKKIETRFNADKNNTKRLVRTEMCRSQQEIINKFDNDHGLQYQLFMATLDGKTSEVCRVNDGKVFKTSDTGKPNPPTGTHPNCRSVLVGIPDKDYKPDTRRNNEDKTIIPYEDYNKWSGTSAKPIKATKPKQQKPPKGELFNSIPQQYHNEIQKQLSNARNKEKEILEKIDSEIKFGDLNYKQTPHYLPSKKEINMDIDKSFNENTTKSKSLSTLWHELGHLVDYQWSKNVSSTESGNFLKALQKDARELKKKAKEGLIKDFNYTAKNINDKDIISYLYHNMKLGSCTGGLSDTLHGATSGKIHLGFGHFGRGYWNEISKQEEAFANFFQVYINGTNQDLEDLKFMFPNANEEYNNIINKMLGER